MNTKIFIFIAAGLLFLVVLLQNTQVAELHFLFWQISMSRIILLPLIMLMGFIVGYFVAKRSC